MRHRYQYDIDAPWFDPFEPRAEHRSAIRFKVQFRISMAVSYKHGMGCLVGAGIVKDMSHTGIRVTTKHQLLPLQDVQLSIPTKLCADDLSLPKSFGDTARVVRVTPLKGRVVEAVLRFSNSLTDNLEFTLFVDTMKSISQVMAR